VKVEGYLVRGITQCFNCNNFYHTRELLYETRCLNAEKITPLEIAASKSDKKTHFVGSTAGTSVTRHVATKCPKFPQPKIVTFYLQSTGFHFLKAHCHLQSTIVSITNASCTTIGPPLLKSRPTLQAQVSKIKKIRVPDRGLKAAGAA
ncbi:hypothetical protein TNCV_32711, partial [Trichonephila clavipes]